MNDNENPSGFFARGYAAMYAALGQQCQLSKAGYEVIFTPGYRLHDRADLSGIDSLASRQLAHAGLDPDQVTAQQLLDYLAWRRETDARHDQDTAHFRITRPQGERQGREANVIQLVVGGEVVAQTAARCREVYDPEAINNMRGKGAYCLRPDHERIRKALATLRRKHPKFASAPVRNNAGAELEDPGAKEDAC